MHGLSTVHLMASTVLAHAGCSITLQQECVHSICLKYLVDSAMQGAGQMHLDISLQAKVYEQMRAAPRDADSTLSDDWPSGPKERVQHRCLSFCVTFNWPCDASTEGCAAQSPHMHKQEQVSSLLIPLGGAQVKPQSAQTKPRMNVGTAASSLGWTQMAKALLASLLQTSILWTFS